MALPSKHVTVTAAVALLCLSMESIGFATPPTPQVGARHAGFGGPSLAPSAWESDAKTASSTYSAQPSALKALALSAAVGTAMGAKASHTKRQALTPDETYKVVIGGGEARIAMTAREIVLQGIVTGFYIGFGGVLCSTVGGSALSLTPGLQRFLFGAVGFPVSIFLTTVAGGQGFTPNIAVMATALFRKGTEEGEREQRLGTVFQNLCLAYFGNSIGLLTIAWLANLGALPAVPAAIEIAKHKVHHTFMEIFVRGILGAWLIGLAVWTAQAADSVASKFVTIWLCISTYVICQYEHCLANIFFVPCAIFAGAPITWSQFIFDNLIPSTLGNFVGGFAFLAGSYRAVYGRKAYAEELAARG